jgi:hypothetical protein
MLASIIALLSISAHAEIPSCTETLLSTVEQAGCKDARISGPNDLGFGLIMCKNEIEISFQDVSQFSLEIPATNFQKLAESGIVIGEVIMMDSSSVAEDDVLLCGESFEYSVSPGSKTEKMMRRHQKKSSR